MMTVLLIRHLPSSLNFHEKEDLLKHFGAKTVRCMPNKGRMKNCAFAEFSSKEEVSLAITRLHQLEILGCQLIAQYAKPQETNLFLQGPDSKKPEPLNTRDDPRQTHNNKMTIQDRKEVIKEQVEQFRKCLNAVAPDFGMTYPFPSNLSYRYPPPTPSIITNIVNALASIPKFYTQVLHLMNKMNIPAPFGPVTITPPLARDPPVLIGTQNVETVTYPVQEMDIISEEESEVESESETEGSTVRNLDRRSLKRPTTRAVRKMKKPRLQQLLVSQSTQPESLRQKAPEASEVFETVEMETKKIHFHLKQGDGEEPSTQEGEKFSSEQQIEEGGFGRIEPQKIAENIDETEDPDDAMWKEVRFVSSRELDRNRISSKEMKSHSVFKNYEPGEPTSRLYVKNLAKQVNEKDLLSIYGKYINRKRETDRNMFDIRLMKEGRMKGQAFVTLANEDQAKWALKDTHGYLLHGKPIVVQFARSAKPKENEGKKSGK